MTVDVRGFKIIKIDTEKATELGWFSPSGEWQYRPHLDQRKANRLFTDGASWFVVHETTGELGDSPIIDVWERIAVKPTLDQLFNQMESGSTFADTIKVSRKITAEEFQAEKERIKQKEEDDFLFNMENSIASQGAPLSSVKKRYLLNDESGAAVYEGKRSNLSSLVETVREDSRTTPFESVVVTMSKKEPYELIATAHHGVMMYALEKSQPIDIHQLFQKIGMAVDSERLKEIPMN